VVSRVKVLRNLDGTGNAAYPLWVCERCGRYAAEDSRTSVWEELDFRLGNCGICAEQHAQVAEPQQFGFPTFYTYKNGEPIRRNT